MTKFYQVYWLQHWQTTK